MASYEIVLTNGRILDGCGNPWFRGDLAILDGRIAGIAPLGTLTGKRVIDLEDRFVSVGAWRVENGGDGPGGTSSDQG
jgi:N-acyl-D-amino-acid deacylase